MKRAKKTPTIGELFLDGRLMDRTMRQAVREALLQYERAGVPVATWRGGKVVRVKVRGGKILPRGAARSSKGSTTKRRPANSK